VLVKIPDEFVFTNPDATSGVVIEPVNIGDSDGARVSI